ncbi:MULTISPECIES: hypothetical protein [unclassified Pseudomonas]|uniref:hypothetical protein n=1 Tax=unclassified Pseudomonas TaxID=196821 RepID=UPI001C608175|nr:MULTISPECIES: hypothetical protein [unclassified Pseudomonas]MBW5416134.1 hypothetical protein [Pseudomonas sp. MAG002Y]
MITLTRSNHDRTVVSLHPDNISSITEAAVSSQWHGTSSIVRTFDGQVLEVIDSREWILRELGKGTSK